MHRSSSEVVEHRAAQEELFAGGSSTGGTGGTGGKATLAHRACVTFEAAALHFRQALKALRPLSLDISQLGLIVGQSQAGAAFKGP